MIDSNYLNYPKEAFIEHYGVKGMRWGIRKSKKSSPRHTGKKRVKTKNQTVRDERKKAYESRRLLSDDELRRRISRLEMEKRFRDLSEEDLFRGRKIVREILLPAGAQSAKTALSGAMLYGGKVALTKDFNFREAADYVTPKPKRK